MSRRRFTFLYRAFDAAGTLLYVGISFEANGRLRDHKQTEWYPQAERVTVESFRDRQSAEAAEKEAIRTEKPVWNVAHNSNNPKRQEPVQEPRKAPVPPPPPPPPPMERSALDHETREKLLDALAWEFVKAGYEDEMRRAKEGGAVLYDDLGEA